MAVLLSLAVAADAGDMMSRAAPRARHGTGTSPSESDTQTRGEPLCAHHPEGTSPDIIIVVDVVIITISIIVPGILQVDETSHSPPRIRSSSANVELKERVFISFLPLTN